MVLNELASEEEIEEAEKKFSCQGTSRKCVGFPMGKSFLSIISEKEL